MTTYRWYIIEPLAGGTYRITGWARDGEHALARMKNGGAAVLASTREQAARRAARRFGIEVAWRKYDRRVS